MRRGTKSFTTISQSSFPFFDHLYLNKYIQIYLITDVDCALDKLTDSSNITVEATTSGVASWSLDWWTGSVNRQTQLNSRGSRRTSIGWSISVVTHSALRHLGLRRSVAPMRPSVVQRGAPRGAVAAFIVCPRVAWKQFPASQNVHAQRYLAGSERSDGAHSPEPQVPFCRVRRCDFTAPSSLRSPSIRLSQNPARNRGAGRPLRPFPLALADFAGSFLLHRPRQDAG